MNGSSSIYKSHCCGLLTCQCIFRNVDSNVNSNLESSWVSDNIYNDAFVYQQEHYQPSVGMSSLGNSSQVVGFEHQAFYATSNLYHSQFGNQLSSDYSESLPSLSASSWSSRGPSPSRLYNPQDDWFNVLGRYEQEPKPLVVDSEEYNQIRTMNLLEFDPLSVVFTESDAKQQVYNDPRVLGPSKDFSFLAENQVTSNLPIVQQEDTEISTEPELFNPPVEELLQCIEPETFDVWKDSSPSRSTQNACEDLLPPSALSVKVERFATSKLLPKSYIESHHSSSSPEPVEDRGFTPDFSSSEDETLDAYEIASTLSPVIQTCKDI
ncbi:hypothetical protein K435DRAFT_849106 [Dendrothele bispora CBS 962.96]|uniref:Uncharacterized protein n=1 Tax=Dendrothele bispora (strain CBS 962.96) TaxID=1314807 RepID=A0A4S8MUE0_DENBC|nr:hypothetical protein K435DRAFT_849106 [Dendrothele bispora CBS 962.96]